MFFLCLQRKGAERKKTYSESDVEKAVQDVHRRKSIRNASKSFNVHYATLYSRVIGKYAIHSTTPGAYSVFTNDEEKELGAVDPRHE